ncbi:MAG: TOBE domain-containing protein, partial [Kiritimatiellae bacterium]|nr:TOBE domain-containing protein [Kiritimatiellia bacterium]
TIEPAEGGLWFNEGGFRVRLRDELAARADAWSGKEVVFGIRPEDIADTLYVGNPAPDHCLKARVDVIEPMGAEVFIYFTTGRHSFVARMNTTEQAEVNQELSLIFSMKKAHLFHPETGARLA